MEAKHTGNAIMFLSRRANLLIVGLLFIGLPSSTSAQRDERKFPAVLHQDLRKQEQAPPLWRPMNDGVLWEVEGARVTLAGGKGPQRAAGLAPSFRVEGDFDVVLAYEILNAEKPDKGFGNGVSLYLAIDADAGFAASTARRVTTNGNTIFASALQHTVAKKPTIFHSKPAQSPTGKLRVERTGKTFRFSFAEGDDPDFKRLSENEFSDEPIRFMQIGGNPGGGHGALDLRLLEVTVRAEHLIGHDGAEIGVVAAAPIPGAAAAGQPVTGPMWLYVGIGVVLSLVFMAILGSSAVLLVRKRTRKPQAPKAIPNQLTMSFVCSKCEKTIKVNRDLAGRRVKCPTCGHTMTAPVPVARTT